MPAHTLTPAQRRDAELGMGVVEQPARILARPVADTGRHCLPGGCVGALSIHDGGAAGAAGGAQPTVTVWGRRLARTWVGVPSQRIPLGGPA